MLHRACLLLALLLLPPSMLAQTPGPAALKRGEAMIDAYFQHQVRLIADRCLADIQTRADWEKRRPEYHRQFLDMLGLWPMPARTDLRAQITGRINTEAFTIEKIHFQSLPGLYVTGNLYVPRQVKEPLPTILYLCGHGKTIIDNVSYGNHVTYQHHPAWFASNGYVCLIIDTLQLGEVQGLHHGTFPQHKMWWWYNLGYTPAGVECWNAIRAIDYLESRKEVDRKRIGVTGRSGGGASSWWIAAADERIACAVPVAGIADLHAHLVEGMAPQFRKGVISGHCDCMYMTNTYRWDFAQVAALVAPRPLLLGNSDVDTIFPVPGYRRLAEKVRKIYKLHGAGDRFELLETAGPHKDTPELRLGAYSWLNRWLKHGGKPSHEVEPALIERELPRFSPQELKVLERLPEDAINATVHETFIKPALPDLPVIPEVAKEWWKRTRLDWLQTLHQKTFRGWTDNPPPVQPKAVADVTSAGLRLRAWEFTSEQGIPLRLWLLTTAKNAQPKTLLAEVLDDAGWEELQGELGPAFATALLAEKSPPLNEKGLQKRRASLEEGEHGLVWIVPRGLGPTRWAGAGTAADHHIQRRFMLLGQTLDGQRVWDVRRALAALRGQPEFQGSQLVLQGKGSMAGIALYAALFEPEVAGLWLEDPPASHRQGPYLLNVARTLDLPQAVALAFPRKVHITVRSDAGLNAWQWPLRLQQALGGKYLSVQKRTH